MIFKTGQCVKCFAYAKSQQPYHRDLAQPERATASEAYKLNYTQKALL